MFKLLLYFWNDLRPSAPNYFAVDSSNCLLTLPISDLVEFMRRQVGLFLNLGL